MEESKIQCPVPKDLQHPAEKENKVVTCPVCHSRFVPPPVFTKWSTANPEPPEARPNCL
jgi:hypothetical protein